MADVIRSGIFGLGETLTELDEDGPANPTLVRAVISEIVEGIVASLALIDREFNLGRGASTRTVRGVPLNGVFTTDVILLRSGRVTPRDVYNPTSLTEMNFHGDTPGEKDAALALCLLQLEVFQQDIERELELSEPTKPQRPRRDHESSLRKVAR